LDKIGLNIDQVSQMTGVKKTTLRYWEKEFSEYLKPDRTDTKRRQYSLQEVEKVGVLKQLIEEEKYKSAGVRLKLGLNGSARPPSVLNVAAPTAASAPQPHGGTSSGSSPPEG
jgi:transposase-like protein